MKKLFGAILILLGIVVGIYIGFWLCFVGGIVNLIQAIKAENISTVNVALGILKLIFASTLGGLSAFIVAFPGYLLLQKER